MVKMLHGKLTLSGRVGEGFYGEAILELDLLGWSVVGGYTMQGRD